MNDKIKELLLSKNKANKEIGLIQFYVKYKDFDKLIDFADNIYNPCEPHKEQLIYFLLKKCHGYNGGNPYLIQLTKLEIEAQLEIYINLIIQ